MSIVEGYGRVKHARRSVLDIAGMPRFSNFSIFRPPVTKKNVFRSESKLKVTYEIGKANAYVVDVSIKYGKITHIR